MNKTFKITLGGIICGLCVLCMLITGFFPYGTYALPAIAGALLFIIVDEFDCKWGYLVFIAVAVLSFFITPDYEAAILFACFFGHYPVTKSLLERIKSRVVEYLLKFFIFNIGLALSFGAMVFLFGLDKVMKDFGEVTLIFGIGIFVFANFIFLIYDIALSRIISTYIKWFKPNFLKRL